MSNLSNFPKFGSGSGSGGGGTLVDTLPNWELLNPILPAGIIGVVAGTQYSKIGNGVDPWMELPYSSAFDQLYSSNVPQPGMFLQVLDGGGRYTSVVDGGNSLGFVSYPSLVPVDPGVGETWTPGQTDFIFTSDVYTPSTTFSF